MEYIFVSLAELTKVYTQKRTHVQRSNYTDNTMGQHEVYIEKMTLRFKILVYTNVLMLRSHTSTAPSLTQANTVDDLGDQTTSYTDF